MSTYAYFDRPPGERWELAAEQALAQCSALVVLWNEDALRSQGVQRELSRFIDWSASQRLDRPIVPLILGGDPNDLPLELVTRGWVELPRTLYVEGPDANPAAWDAVVEQVQAALLAPSEEAPDMSPLWLDVVDGGKHLGWAWLLAPEVAIWSIWEAPAANRAHAVTVGDRVLLQSSRGGMVEGIVTTGLPPQLDGHDGIAVLELATPLNSPTWQTGPVRGRNAVVVQTPPQHGPVVTELLPSADGASYRVPVPDGTPVGSPVWDAGRACVVGWLGRRGDEGMHQFVEWETAAALGFDPAARPLSPPAPTAKPSQLPPTARVHTDSWTVEDQLDYGLYARAIEQFIRHRATRAPLVISVQGPWGQGKSSLMRMVQSRLDPGHPDLRQTLLASEDPAAPSALTYRQLRESLEGKRDVADPTVQPDELQTVWFNAWKYQSSEALWAGLAHAILDQLPARLSRRRRELFWLRLQRRRIDPAAVRREIHRVAFERFLPWLGGCLAVLVLAAVALAFGGAAAIVGAIGAVGATLTAALAAVLAHRSALDRRLEGSYARVVQQPDYAEKMGYLHHVERDMVQALDLLTPDDQPTVIFIDDLDRCAPAKIGEVLEAINLFLSGDYPNCVFVLGIDTEVVAAAMEVVHEPVLAKLKGRRDELGWRFMDKFVQLPFVMPRLSKPQRLAYVAGLLDEKPEGIEVRGITTKISAIRDAVSSGALTADEGAQQIGAIGDEVTTSALEAIREVAEEVIAIGAGTFDDDSREVVEALGLQLRFLSDNPRTIKRAVNLYRFHRFTAWARKASPLGLRAAEPELIARWVVVVVRWPNFVRWLQTNDDDAAVATIASSARDASTHTQWRKARVNRDGEQQWHDEVDLWAFLRDDEQPPLDLSAAAACGLW